MLHTLRAIVRDGKIELLEPVMLPDGIQLLVTVLTDEEPSFWQHASETALARVWGSAHGTTSNSVDRYVSYLRRKLGEPLLIETVRGTGFVLGR